MTHSPAIRRAEFSRRTKLQAWDRAGGCCEDCGKKIRPGDGPEYDHIISAEQGGGNDLGNCQVLCAPCHKLKTREDVGKQAKSRSVRAGHIGAKKPRNPIPGSKASKWKRTIDGRTVRR